MSLVDALNEAFLQLKKLLEPFGIRGFCTDGWGAYERHLPAELHEVGKRKTRENRAETFEIENAHQAASAENNLLFQA
jgi:IS1 family transposase